ncbi:MAG: hypothetical protein Q8930_04895, partial [Bacillota bacterium]|nr:hypothetical protein [Bacillota bacterium]
GGVVCMPDKQKTFMTADELNILTAIVASTIARRVTPEQATVVGAFLAGVAASLATITAKIASDTAEQEALKRRDEIENQIKDLRNQLRELGSR